MKRKVYALHVLIHCVFTAPWKMSYISILSRGSQAKKLENLAFNARITMGFIMMGNLARNVLMAASLAFGA